MIGAVHGRLAGRTADRVLIATPGGVTYEIAVPLGVLERLPSDARDIELTTVLVVREDAWALFGFDDPTERTVFQRLLGATGVGPRLALAMLSALGGASRVVRAIRDNDLATLCTVPGVGRKTAERIVVELKDKVADLAKRETAATARAPAAEQAVQALVGLGYPAIEADRAVRTVVSKDGAGDPVDVIRRSLQLLTGTR